MDASVHHPGLAAVISLNCRSSSTNPAAQVPPKPPGVVNPGFVETDCSNPNVTFPNITIGSVVSDTFDGPQLNCNSTTEGANGSVTHSLIIVTYKADKLSEAYLKAKADLQPNVDDATVWNAQPDMPEEEKNNINIFYNENDGYIFMITSEAVDSNFISSLGYGVEMVNDRYLVYLQFKSNELSDAAAAANVLKSLQATALTAIIRLDNQINH